MLVKKSNSANINVSLSWIFMIVVGSFFIIFSYNVIDTYKENEDIKYSLELKQSLRTILNQIGKTTDNDQIKFEYLDSIFQDTKVEILCNNGEPLLALNDDLDPNNQFLNNYPTFMTEIEESSVPTTYLAVESFNMPFKITELVAIVSTKNIIILDESLDIADELLEKFAKGAYRDKIIIETINSNDQNVNLDLLVNSIMENKNPSSILLIKPLSSQISLPNDLDIPTYDLVINKLENRAYEISYEQYLSNVDNTPKKFGYYDYEDSLSLITMAMFSSPQTFECSYNLLLKKIEPVYNFYIDKLELIKQEDNICSLELDNLGKNLKYQNLLDSLKKIINADNQIFDENQLAYKSNPNLEDSFINPQIAKLYIETGADSVDSNFKELEKFSCVYIY